MNEESVHSDDSSEFESDLVEEEKEKDNSKTSVG